MTSKDKTAEQRPDNVLEQMENETNELPETETTASMNEQVTDYQVYSADLQQQLDEMKDKYMRMFTVKHTFPESAILCSKHVTAL